MTNGLFTSGGNHLSKRRRLAKRKKAAEDRQIHDAVLQLRLALCGRPDLRKRAIALLQLLD